jgi:hypothetical protein
MRMSDFGKVHRLANKRRHMVMLLSGSEEGDPIEVTVGGWQGDISDSLSDAIAVEIARHAKAELERIEAELLALGVQIDIPREAYTHRDLPEWETADQDEDASDEAEAGEVTNAAA